MRRNGVSNATVVGLLAAGILIGLTGFYVVTTYQAKTATHTETTIGSIEITSANISTTALWVTVKNTGNLNLVELGEPTISSGGSVPAYFCAYNEYSWKPSPSPTNPIYPGEEVTGGCTLISAFSSGQATIYVPSTFSDGSQMKASTVITVS